MKYTRHLSLFLILVAVCAMPDMGRAAQQSPAGTEVAGGEPNTYGDKLGTVNFRASCRESVQPLIERGFALLHHMTYEGARSAFAKSTEVDPECAMGYWGQAMTFIHPLWSDAPSEAVFEKGRGLVNMAESKGPKTPREAAYIAAAKAYYDAGWHPDEKKNLVDFEKGWEQVFHSYPEDSEAACFYALAHMANADPGDKTYARQRQSGAIAEKVLARTPDHPGAHHYIIHAYDYPALAANALNVARNYGEIAPAIPHALHMPTHIFTRLGLWEDSITMNKRSAAAALEHPVGGAISLHYLHALDYLAYAYLQQGDDENAKQVMDEIKALQGPYQVHIAASYTFTAVPARIALERQKWAEAAALEPKSLENYELDSFPAMVAITYFARAMGAARSGNVPLAVESIEAMAMLRDKAAETSAYWAKQIEIQRLSALAWTMYQEGDSREALKVMHEAADMEASTEKHPVTPGEILPARELLADMLLDMGRYDEARHEYESALKRSVNRFNSLYGAGRAAEMQGDKAGAMGYYPN